MNVINQQQLWHPLIPHCLSQNTVVHYDSSSSPTPWGRTIANLLQYTPLWSPPVYMLHVVITTKESTHPSMTCQTRVESNQCPRLSTSSSSAALHPVVDHISDFRTVVACLWVFQNHKRHSSTQYAHQYKQQHIPGGCIVNTLWIYDHPTPHLAIPLYFDLICVSVHLNVISGGRVLSRHKGRVLSRYSGACGGHLAVKGIYT